MKRTYQPNNRKKAKKPFGLPADPADQPAAALRGGCHHRKRPEHEHLCGIPDAGQSGGHHCPHQVSGRTDL